MTTDCSAVNIYDSLRFCKGKNTFPGIRPMVFFIPKSLIVKWPTLPDVDAEDATMESIACYDGDFVLAADAVFLSLIHI